MITLNHVQKQFGSKVLFKDCSLQIGVRDRVGLIGPNGSGKTTLFRMILGEESIDDPKEQERLAKEYGKLQERYTLLGGYGLEAEAKRILQGLGFKERDFDRLTDELSGGWGVRMALAKILLQSPDLLLLDEPTNHLDLVSLIWLEEFLT